jgi:hypothetical protein
MNRTSSITTGLLAPLLEPTRIDNPAAGQHYASARADDMSAQVADPVSDQPTEPADLK